MFYCAECLWKGTATALVDAALDDCLEVITVLHEIGALRAVRCKKDDLCSQQRLYPRFIRGGEELWSPPVIN